MAVSRKFHWVSSVLPENREVIERLNKRMAEYYSSEATRSLYNALIVDNPEAPNDTVSLAFANWMQQHHPKKIVEIGCGNGRVWRLLDNQNKHYDYTGVEVDEKTIASNSAKWPAQRWITSAINELQLEANTFDCCFSLYVLEHLTTPKLALDKMWSLVKHGGYIVLIFPDFSATQRFPSQQLGWGYWQSAAQKLRKGRLLDTLLSYYDSRFRLKPALRNLSKSSGAFLVNTNPVCLHYGKQRVWPDIDAVYLAHKKELNDWASEKGAQVSYPCGTNAPFDEHCFMTIQKPV